MRFVLYTPSGVAVSNGVAGPEAATTHNARTVAASVCRLLIRL